jgi:NADH-quinone oxidoreductase subunit A
MATMYPYYLPLIFMFVLAIGFATVTLALTHVLGPRKHTRVKYDVPYESGVDPITTERVRFDVKFYLVAMIFVVFDLEVVYFYPWAMVFREFLRQSLAILWDMFIFTGILSVGFIYAWRKRAFDW